MIHDHEKNPVFVRACRLARRKKYNEAIKFLDAEESRYYGNFTYNYLLGLCYLHTAGYPLALKYFKQARDQKMRDPQVLLGMAVLYLNRGDTARAVDLYLEVQDMDERNRIVRRALRVIQKHAGPENIFAWIETGRLRTLFPPFPKTGPSLLRVILTSLCLLILSAGAGGFFLLKTGRISLPSLSLIPRISGRTGLQESSLDQSELDAPMQTEGGFRYILTKDEAIKLFKEAQKFYTSWHDEKARVALNRILESNASEGVKNKAHILISYMDVPGFDTLKDHFSYAEVKEEPWLYRDCHVIWRGKAANLEQKQQSTSFDLLVGYDTGKVMEGLVHTEVPFAVAVNPERPLEVLGRIIPVVSEKGMDIRLEGLALNQAGLLEQERGRGK